MGRTVIAGAGGHGREILDILLDCKHSGQPVEPLGFLDERRARGDVDGFPILGDLGWLDDAPDGVEVVCAVGDPSTLRDLVSRVVGSGVELASAVSPRALLSPRAALGRGVVIFPGVVINTGARIGNHVTLNVGVSVSHDTVVGDFCNLNPGAQLAGNVELGEGCYVGMGASVIQRVSIGEWATIGAGACVTGDLPGQVTAVGVPARVVSHDDCASQP